MSALAMEARFEHRRMADFSTPLDTVGFVRAVAEGAGWSCCCFGSRDESSDSGMMTTIKSEFGTGTLLYFRYVQFLVFLNGLLSLFAIGEYAAVDSLPEKLNPTGAYSSVDQFFTAAFPPSARDIWYGFGAIQLLLALLAGPCFWWVGSRYQNRWRGADRVDESASTDRDYIEENRFVTEGSRAARKTVSVVIFSGIIVGQAFLMLWLHRVLADTTDSITALIVAAIIPGLNGVWKAVSKFLTKIEAHPTRSQATEWDTGKVFLVKVINILTLYGVKAAVATERGASATGELAACPRPGVDIDCRCPLAGMGWQFFWLFVSDLTMSSFLEMFIPVVTLCATRRLGCGKNKGDEESRPEFDLSEEFVQLLYRQLLVYLGAVVLPFTPLMGTIGALIALTMDKYRLVAVCRKPRDKQRPVRPALLMACHIIVAIAAIVSYPNGLAFLFAGYNIQNVCSFWPFVG
jgi:hypothetical protein